MYSELETIDIGSHTQCPFCKSNALHSEDNRLLIEMYTCPTCGKYRLSSMVNLWLRGLNQEEREKLYKISFVLRSTAERGLGKQDNSYFPVYSPEDLARMLADTELTVRQKLDLLIRFLARATQHPGQRIEFDNVHDYTVACAKNQGEVMFYFDTLVDRKLISHHQPFTGSSNPRAMITAEGWNALSELEKIGEQSSSAFIAMAFSRTRDQFEQAISKAIQQAGYLPIRVDQVEHVNKIDDEIIARIRAAKFLVADFTLQRNGVYFEAGFMLGLGRHVIWLCEKTELDKVHFDTRQYNTIDYTDAEELTRRLRTRIEAILGQGPLKI